MTFTYTNNPATVNRDAVRMLLNDTSSSDVLLQDEEITFLLNAKPNVWLAASAGAAAIASRFARDGGDRQVGDLRISRGAVVQEYRALAKQLRAEGVRGVKPYSGGIGKADSEAQIADSDWKRGPFRIGRFDNPGASTST